MLLLDLGVPAEQRAKTLADIRAQVQAGGELLLEQDWGERALAYQIDHREQADYHLLQLHGDGPLISSLERTLRITDGVIRHRIIKLAPGTPAAPEQGPRQAPVVAVVTEGESPAPAVAATPA